MIHHRLHRHLRRHLPTHRRRLLHATQHRHTHRAFFFLIGFVIILIGLLVSLQIMQLPSQDDRSRADVAPLIETPVGIEATVSGKVTIIHEDYSGESRGREKYYLDRQIGTPLILDKNPDLQAGTTVTVTGSQSVVDGVARLSTSTTSKFVVTATPTPIPAVVGGKRAAILLVNFTDNRAQVLTSQQAQSLFETKAIPFFKENSFGKLTLAAQVFGWFSLPIPSTCDLLTIELAAIAAADSQVNFAQFQELILVYPASCGYLGAATIGKGISMKTQEGIFAFPVAGISADHFSLEILSHELGHNFGAWHANGYECGSVSIDGNCSSTPYADYRDPLGGKYLPYHFNARHKQFFGWVPATNQRTVTAPGVYTLLPLEKITTGSQIISVRKDSTHWYTIEQRTPKDQEIGLYIHLAGAIMNSGDTHVIDLTPNSQSGDLDFFDSNLGLGKTFFDPTAHVAITLLSQTSASATVAIGALPYPRLEWPTPQSTVYVSRPSFFWTTAPQATSYTVQISTVPTFTTLITQGSAGTGTFIPMVDLPKKKTLYWRVQARSPFGSSAWSPPTSFVSANPPGIPILKSPSNTSLVQSLQPALLWYPVTAAGAYHLQISTDRYFASGDVHNDTISATSLPRYTPLAPLNVRTTYYWRVSSLGYDGSESSFSLPWNFRTP